MWLGLCVGAGGLEQAWVRWGFVGRVGLATAAAGAWLGQGVRVRARGGRVRTSAAGLGLFTSIASQDY